MVEPTDNTDVTDEIIESTDPAETWKFQWKNLVEADISTLTRGAIRRRDAMLKIVDYVNSEYTRLRNQFMKFIIDSGVKCEDEIAYLEGKGPDPLDPNDIRGRYEALLHEIMSRRCENQHGYGCYTPCHARGPKGPIRRRSNWCPTCIARSAFNESVYDKFVSEVSYTRDVIKAAKRFVNLNETASPPSYDINQNETLNNREQVDDAYEYMRSLLDDETPKKYGTAAFAIIDAAKELHMAEISGRDITNAQLRLRRATIALLETEGE